MLKISAIGLLSLLVFTALPVVEGQGAFSTGTTEFHSCQNAAAVALVIIAGEFCVHFTHPQWALSNTAALRIAVTVSGPGILTGVSVGVTATNSAQVGCSTAPGNWIYNLGTGSLASGFGASARAVLTMSANECQAVFRMQIQLAVGGAVVLERNFEYAYAIYVQPALGIYDYWCNAPAISANAFSPTTTPCNSATATIADDANGWALTDDKCRGVSTDQCYVTLADDKCRGVSTDQCYVTLSGTNTTMQSNSTVTTDVSRMVSDWMPLALAMALLAIAVMRERPNYWVAAISGVLSIGAAYFCPWPNNGAGYAAQVLLIVLGFYHLALYGMDVKDWNEERKRKRAEAGSE